VARGFTQEYGVDYEETFAPVARLSSMCALLAVVASRHWALSQIDVKYAFLNGDLSEEVYMQSPPGLFSPPNKVCRLLNLVPLSLVLATPSAPMTPPCLFVTQIEV